MKLIKKYQYSGKIDTIEAGDPMEETRQRIQDRLNNNTYYWIDTDGSLKKDYLTDEAELEDYAQKSGAVTPLNWEFNLLAPARFGLGALANGVRTGLQAMNTAFTPSTWLNPVTGAKLLSPTVGTIADAGIQGAFAYEGLNGLWNQSKEGTLLSNPGNTIMHGLETLPLFNLGLKGLNSLSNSNSSISGSRFMDFVNSKTEGIRRPLYDYLETHSNQITDKIRDLLSTMKVEVPDAMARVSGDPKYQHLYRPGLLDEDVNYMLHNSVARNQLAQRKAGYSEGYVWNKAHEAFSGLNDARYAELPDNYFWSTGKPTLKGKRTRQGISSYISKRKGIPRRTVRHELRHVMQDVYQLTPEQQKILEEAYGEDFLNIANTTPRYKNYSLRKEMEPVNQDSRSVILEENNIENASIEHQNKVMDDLTDEQVFNAVENADGYGKAYIDYLRESNLLTPEKAKAFREAMKHVGAYLPWISGSSIGYNYLNQNK